MSYRIRPLNFFIVTLSIRLSCFAAREELGSSGPHKQRLHLTSKLRVGTCPREKPGPFLLRQAYRSMKQTLDFLP